MMTEQAIDIITLILPLLLVLYSIYTRSKGKTTDRKIDIILESLPDAKDKITEIIKKRGSKNAKKSDN